MDMDHVNKIIDEHNKKLDNMTPEQRKDYYASVGLELDESSEIKTEKASSEMIEVKCVNADEVISDHTFEEIMRLIMNATSEEEAKKIFFENVITLMNCKEVNQFFDEERIDENGKRYTLDRRGNKMYFVIDLVRDQFNENSKTNKEEKDEEYSGPSDEVQKNIDRYKTKLHNGYFDNEFNRSREDAKGPGKPLDLSEEGRAKEVQDFDDTLEKAHEQLPNIFGPSRTRTKNNNQGENNN